MSNIKLRTVEENSSTISPPAGIELGRYSHGAMEVFVPFHTTILQLIDWFNPVTESLNKTGTNNPQKQLCNCLLYMFCRSKSKSICLKPTFYSGQCRQEQPRTQSLCHLNALISSYLNPNDEIVFKIR